MATYAMGDLKKGLKIELDGVPFKIVEYQHVKPGKGPAFVRIKIKSFLDGKVLEKTIHAGDKCEAPNLEDKQMQYLYDDGENCQFMDTATYEQVAISDDDVGDAKKWMLDGMMVDVMFHNGKSSKKGIAPVSSSMFVFMSNQKSRKKSNADSRLDFPLAFAP